MKKLTTFLLALFSLTAYSQFEAGEEITIDNTQSDDTYIAGETINVNAPIQGDLVIAGGTWIVNEAIQGDLSGAGGEITINGPVADDVRVAGGKVTIDSEVGDDVVVFGGAVFITENARIKGKLVCSSGDVVIHKGAAITELKVSGGDVFIDGSVTGTSKITADELTLGSNAKFYKNVEYYHSEGEINFNTALVDAEARFNEDLEEESPFSLFGEDALKKWLIFILSAFLGILVFHALFRKAFLRAVESLENNVLKSFGFGLLYLVGIPVAIILAFIITIGVKLGLFAAAIYVFSLLFGLTVASILIAYYLRKRYGKNWGFWPVTFIALGIAILLRLLSMIPYAGIAVIVILIAVTYGALILMAFRKRKQAIST